MSTLVGQVFTDSFIISITQIFLSSVVSPDTPPGSFNVSIFYVKLGWERVISSRAEEKHNIADIK